MAFTDAARWFLSMLQVATTWQSASFMKLPVLPGACMPQPTTPMVMRSEGAGRPSAPRALAGMIVGAAMAVAVVAIKRRREILEVIDFISSDPAELSVCARAKNVGWCFAGLRSGTGFRPGSPVISKAQFHRSVWIV